MGLIHKEYYSANATYLSDENIKEIKASMGNMSNAVNKMSKKFHISHARVLDYINNRERKQQMIKRSQPPALRVKDQPTQSVSVRGTPSVQQVSAEKKKVKTKAGSSKSPSSISESSGVDIASVMEEMENNIAETNRILAMS
jgi:hypothetical protein